MANERLAEKRREEERERKRRKRMIEEEAERRKFIKEEAERREIQRKNNIKKKMVGYSYHTNIPFAFRLLIFHG